jgi:hypothetical protein
VRLAFARTDTSAGCAAPEEVEEDPAVRVGPGHEGQARAHLDSHPQLLVELSGEAALDRLAGLALPARELPQAAEMLGGIPSGHEEPPAPREDRGGDLDHREACPPRQLGEEREK